MAPLIRAIFLTAMIAAASLGAYAAKSGASPDGQDFDAMDIMMHEQEERFASQDDRICEQVAGSKAFQNWIQHFNKGDLKSAEKDWAEVLAQLKKLGCDNCSHINRMANERTLMLETTGRPKPIWPHLLAATEHAVGPNDHYTAECFKFLAMQAEGSGDYVKATAWRKRQYDILLQAKGKSSDETVDAANWLRKDTLQLKRKNEGLK